MLNPCSICDANCCKSYTITVTIFDILRISKNTNKNPKEIAFLHPLKILSFDPDMVIDTIEGDAFLLGLKSHPCIFLGKDNLCTIHEFAPLSCRRYPYQTNNKINTRFCPTISSVIFRIKGPEKPVSPLLEELEKHKKIVKKWNEKNGSKKEIIDFFEIEAKKLI